MINLGNLANVRFDKRPDGRLDSNTILAELPGGDPVTFARKLSRWDAMLIIHVRGRYVHGVVAGDAEKAAWQTLENLANNAIDDGLSSEMDKVREACGFLFTPESNPVNP